MQIIPCAIDGEIFEYQDLLGVTRRYRLNIEDDDTRRYPWEECDGHGIVSDWTTRDKRPGERVLNTDRSSKRYYDVQASQKIALRDGWGGEGKTKRERAAHAVARDFDYLRAWCNDEWRYVGVIVTLLSDDPEEDDATPTDYTYALWGIESDCDDHIKNTALELAGQIARELTGKEAA